MPYDYPNHLSPETYLALLFGREGNVTVCRSSTAMNTVIRCLLLRRCVLFWTRLLLRWVMYLQYLWQRRRKGRPQNAQLRSLLPRIPWC
jgi:hypothetical protein